MKWIDNIARWVAAHDVAEIRKQVKILRGQLEEAERMRKAHENIGRSALKEMEEQAEQTRRWRNLLFEEREKWKKERAELIRKIEGIEESSRR